MTWPVIKSDDRRILVNANELKNAKSAYVSTFFQDMRKDPNSSCGLDTQILYGEKVLLLEQKDSWSKIQNLRDRYVGWLKSDGISMGDYNANYRQIVPRSFLYPDADLKSPRIGYRSLGSEINIVEFIENNGTRYGQLSDGSYIIARHIAPLNDNADDFVTVAETLTNTPYLWAGATAFGIDCSGLVQLSMRLAGINVMRDSDMQAASIGTPIDLARNWNDLKRGDLIFWRGHVAIAQGQINNKPHLIHANGYTMDVTSEPAEQAIERIAYLYEKPIGVRRPAALGIKSAC